VDAIQFLAGINNAGTSRGFGFGVGGIYKRTLFGGENGGFHLGGGLGLGTFATNASVIDGATSTDFAMNIPLIAGVHFKVPNTGIAFHFDGGTVFGLITATRTAVSFTMGQLSALMGASVAYEF
jgi:hypothetical protein